MKPASPGRPVLTLLVAGFWFRGSAPFSLAVGHERPAPPPKGLLGMPRLDSRPQRRQHAASRTGSPSSVLDSWMPDQAEEEELLKSPGGLKGRVGRAALCIVGEWRTFGMPAVHEGVELAAAARVAG